MNYNGSMFIYKSKEGDKFEVRRFKYNQYNITLILDGKLLLIKADTIYTVR